jgi:hypothetical protein
VVYQRHFDFLSRIVTSCRYVVVVFVVDTLIVDEREVTDGVRYPARSSKSVGFGRCVANRLEESKSEGF